ncbi:MAG: acylglycerol kinase family protein [Novosphingobium sp.]
MHLNPLTWLCVNAASGSNDAAAVRGVTQALEAAGAPPRRVLDIPAHGLPTRRELTEAGVGLLAIFTGDGTVNAVVTTLEGWGGKILVLPGGTANLLARALHGERDTAQILADRSALHPVRRPCIRTSRGTALIELLAGPGATWSDVREDLREGNLPGVAASSLSAIRQSMAGPMVTIAEPPLGRREGYAGVRLEVGEEDMLVEGYGSETIADYLLHGLALLRRDYRQGPHEDLGAVREVLCRSHGGAPIELMIDGERQTGGAEERFSLARLAVDLLASAR